MGTEYFKHALYSPFFFSSKCSLFHNANLFGSCIIHILYTECAKIKKKKFGAKRLISFIPLNPIFLKLSGPWLGLAKVFLKTRVKTVEKIFGDILHVWRNEFTSTIFPTISVTS